MKILIVEDDFASRELLKISITKDGYDCKAAEDGEAGLHLFNAYKPDVVISDVRMPKMDGILLLESIRKISNSVIIIIVTGHGNENLALQALQLGANNYIKKPLDLADLKSQLKRYKRFIDAQTMEKNISDLVVERNIELEIETDLHMATITAKYLSNKTETAYATKAKLGLELGLSELITNAVEHGNMNITHAEKSKALEENILPHLYTKRLSEISIKDKKVKIQFQKKREYCEWIIEDQGDGFNYNKVPRAMNNPLLADLHGRGIFISQMQFDEMEYIGKGNIVRLKKYIQHD